MEILVTHFEMKRSHFMTKPLINMTFMNLINEFNELTSTEIYLIVIVVNNFSVHLSLKQVKNYD